MSANGMIPGQTPPTRCALCGAPLRVRHTQLCLTCMDAVIDGDPGEEGEIAAAEAAQHEETTE